jgi:hypothetical protein
MDSWRPFGYRSNKTWCNWMKCIIFLLHLWTCNLCGLSLINSCELVIFNLWCNCWNWWLNLESWKAGSLEGCCGSGLVLLISYCYFVVCLNLESWNEAMRYLKLWMLLDICSMSNCQYILLHLRLNNCQYILLHLRLNSSILSGTGYPPGKKYPRGCGYGTKSLPVCGCGRGCGCVLAGAGVGV